MKQIVKMDGTLFLTSAVQQFRDYKRLADRTFEQIDAKDFYVSPEAFNNSIAVIIKHMHGNMISRWTNFLTEDGEKEWRKRDEEFQPDNHDQEHLLQLWEEGWQVLFSTLAALTPADLDKTIFIRTKPLSVIEAIHRQLTHYASHVGQIIYIGKYIKQENWQTLSIKKGTSKIYNEQMKS